MTWTRFILTTTSICLQESFSRACIFGYLRVIQGSDAVYPYRMDMDFGNRTCQVFKGKTEVKLDYYLPVIKCLLENPETIVFSRLNWIFNATEAWHRYGSENCPNLNFYAFILLLNGHAALVVIIHLRFHCNLCLSLVLIVWMLESLGKFLWNITIWLVTSRSTSLYASQVTVSYVKTKRLL